jgi:peroxiredoxin
MIRLASVSLVAALIAFGVSQGQTTSKKFSLGDACPSFKLPGTDDKEHSLTEYKKDVLVVIITCNHCPMAIAYEDRIIKFTKDNPKVDVVAINVNNGEKDRMPRMKERALEKGFNFPYLYDESQAIARSLEAKSTPHFFVFNKDRKLVFQGAMDDNADPALAKTVFLAEACKAAAEGKSYTATDEQRVRGCPVAYDAKK